MKKNKKQKTTTEEIFSKKELSTSKKALKATEIYKETAEILEKANLARGEIYRYELQNQSTRSLMIRDHGIKNTYKV